MQLLTRGRCSGLLNAKVWQYSAFAPLRVLPLPTLCTPTLSPLQPENCSLQPGSLQRATCCVQLWIATPAGLQLPL